MALEKPTNQKTISSTIREEIRSKCSIVGCLCDMTLETGRFAPFQCSSASHNPQCITMKYSLDIQTLKWTTMELSSAFMYDAKTAT